MNILDTLVSPEMLYLYKCMAGLFVLCALLTALVVMEGK